MRGPCRAAARQDSLEHLAERNYPHPSLSSPEGEDVESYVLMKHLVVMIVAVGAGVWVSRGLTSLGLTLPDYIGAMLVAAVFRNLDMSPACSGLSQKRHRRHREHRAVALPGDGADDAALWELAGLVIPLLVILAAQVALIAAVCIWVVPRLMGRDYDSAVMSGGFCGFMLGTSANAMANMGALVERYGPAPKAYLVVPLVGAFFIDFANALLITFSKSLALENLTRGRVFRPARQQAGLK